MSLRVIGAGFGRTGTASLKKALDILGMGPCHHFFEIRRAQWKARRWLPVIRGGQPDWDRILAGYESTVDWPSCSFYAELADAFPQAKVILTNRDPADWYESTRRTLYPLRCAIPPWARWVPPMRDVLALLDELIWNGTFAGQFEDRQKTISIYEDHAQAVARRIPPERLLIFRAEDGWEPLCAFLGVDVPDEEFPWVNQRAEIERAIKAIRLATGALYGIGAFLVIALIAQLAGI